MPKKKLTIAEQLVRRKYTTPPRIYASIYHLLGSRRFIASKYNPEYIIKDDINDCKGPCILIWNHLSRIDHSWLMTAAYPRRYNMVAGYNEFFRKHLHTVFKLMRIIPKKSYTQDMISVRAMNYCLKHNGCLTFSPEGTSSIFGMNQPIVPGTGKFIKHYKVPVYFAKLEGGYLTNTKVCLDERIGKVRLTLSLLFTPEDLEKMTADEVQDKINEVFHHDDYLWNKKERIHFVQKKKGPTRYAHHLNDILYRCPRCGKEEMVAEGDKIYCAACGNGASIDDLYDFHPFDESCIIPETPSIWSQWERKEIIKEINANPDFRFETDVKIGCLRDYEYVPHKGTTFPCGTGHVVLDHQGIHIDGTKDGKPIHYDLSYAQYYSVIITNDCSMFSLFTDDDNYYDFIPDTPCVGKIIHIVEEMHRHHFNYWKNLPWYDDMYEGMKLGIDVEKKD